MKNAFPFTSVNIIDLLNNNFKEVKEPDLLVCSLEEHLGLKTLTHSIQYNSANQSIIINCDSSHEFHLNTAIKRLNHIEFEIYDNFIKDIHSKLIPPRLKIPSGLKLKKKYEHLFASFKIKSKYDPNPPYHLRSDIFHNPSNYFAPPFTGFIIELPLSTGIINFIDQNFLQGTWLLSLTQGEIFRRNAATYYVEPFKCIASARFEFLAKNLKLSIKCDPSPDSAFEFVQNIMLAHAICYSADYCSKSLYTALCPPLLHPSILYADTNKDISLNFQRYQDHISSLQKNCIRFLEYCFDLDFEPDKLGNLTAFERYIEYLRNYRYQFNGFMDDFSFAPVTSFEKSSRPLLPKERIYPNEPNLIAEQHYELSTTYELLKFEFAKMLEENVKLRKCRKCGKYFRVTGNREQYYCTRPFGLGKLTCRELGTVEKHRKKKASLPAHAVYDKYYRRYYARTRLKSNKITLSVFEAWSTEAMNKRNLCNEGKLSLEEYIEWNEAYFPNRKKKSST